jgi:hypothetical protein
LLALAPALAAFAVTENILIHACGLALFVYLGLVDTWEARGAIERNNAVDQSQRKEESPWTERENARQQP